MKRHCVNCYKETEQTLKSNKDRPALNYPNAIETVKIWICSECGKENISIALHM